MTRRLAQQVRALERQVERKLAQRHRIAVTGPAVIEIGPGVEVEVVRRVWTRVEVVSPKERPLNHRQFCPIFEATGNVVNWAGQEMSSSAP
jgi:hypothetical protein